MISSALSSDSDDVTKLLNVSLDLIAPSTKPKTAVDATSSKAAASKPGRGVDVLKDGAEVADSERAVEVLSFLVSKTKVRRFRQRHNVLTRVQSVFPFGLESASMVWVG